MLKTAYRPITVIGLAALIASAVMILPGTSDRVVASAPLHSGKSDRLDIRPLGTNCSQQAWPYFEAECLRDRRSSMGKARSARIVSVDRPYQNVGR